MFLRLLCRAIGAQRFLAGFMLFVGWVIAVRDGGLDGALSDWQSVGLRILVFIWMVAQLICGGILMVGGKPDLRADIAFAILYLGTFGLLLQDPNAPNFFELVPADSSAVQIGFWFILPLSFYLYLLEAILSLRSKPVKIATA